MPPKNSKKNKVLRRNVYTLVNQYPKQYHPRNKVYKSTPSYHFFGGPPTHDERLLELENAPKVIPVKERGEGGFNDIPSTDLLEAIHYYIARNYLREAKIRVNPYEKLMDESALLAFGLMVEHMVDDHISKEGHLKYAVDQNERKFLDHKASYAGLFQEESKTGNQRRLTKKGRNDRMKQILKAKIENAELQEEFERLTNGMKKEYSVEEEVEEVEEESEDEEEGFFRSEISDDNDPEEEPTGVTTFHDDSEDSDSEFFDAVDYNSD